MGERHADDIVGLNFIARGFPSPQDAAAQLAYCLARVAKTEQEVSRLKRMAEVDRAASGRCAKRLEEAETALSLLQGTATSLADAMQAVKVRLEKEAAENLPNRMTVQAMAAHVGNAAAHQTQLFNLTNSLRNVEQITKGLESKMLTAPQLAPALEALTTLIAQLQQQRQQQQEWEEQEEQEEQDDGVVWEDIALAPADEAAAPEQQQQQQQQHAAHTQAAVPAAVAAPAPIPAPVPAPIPAPAPAPIPAPAPVSAPVPVSIPAAALAQWWRPASRRWRLVATIPWASTRR